jgi:hypothetical protein
LFIPLETFIYTITKPIYIEVYTMAEESCYLGKEDGIKTCESCWAKSACGKTK